MDPDATPAVPPRPAATPIRFFTALTRALRDQPAVDDAVRARAMDLLTRLAELLHQPGFAPCARELLALGERDAQLATAIAPFAEGLRAWAREAERLAPARDAAVDDEACESARG